MAGFQEEGTLGSKAGKVVGAGWRGRSECSLAEGRNFGAVAFGRSSFFGVAEGLAGTGSSVVDCGVAGLDYEIDFDFVACT